MNIIINIDVPDLARGIEFYTRALGLTHTRTLDGDTAELKGASSTLYLLCKPAGSVAVKAPPVSREFTRHWTPVHLDFVVPDVDAAAERALRAGAKRESDTVDWKGSRCITFADPFGHGFCLIAFEAGGTYTS